MSRFDDLAKDHPPLSEAFRVIGDFLDTHSGITEFRLADARNHCGHAVSLAEFCVATIVLEKHGYIEERFELLNPATWTAAPELFADLRDIPDVLKDASGAEFDSAKGEVSEVFIVTEKVQRAATV